VAHSVFYVDLGIELNLTLPDLGHPVLPGLWQELKTMKYRPGRLQCPQCRDNDPDCPEWMYLQERSGGRRLAVHHNPGIRAHDAVESDTHKALKERIASAAVGGGFTADTESRAEHGARRTDVLVQGSDGFLLGCEAQVSYATASSIRKRTDIARRDGITSLWTTNDRKAQLIDQAPWARIDRMPWHQIANGAELPVRGGIRTLQMQRCADRPTVCPDRKRGRCANWHASWTPREMRLDDLIVRAAAQECQPVHVPRARGAGHWFWVTAADKATYLSSLTDAPPDTETTPTPSTPATVRPKPLSRSCRYGLDAGIRDEAAPIRDLGAWVEAPTVTRTHFPATTTRPAAPDTALGTIQLDPAPTHPNWLSGRSISSVDAAQLLGPGDIDDIGMDTGLTDTLDTVRYCGHVWPGELEADSACQHCGLEYLEYST
jgi:hypothetical protein